ncbi:hypothetical protein AIIKEEIJ_06237 [Rhodococcus sp. YH1]|nr:hypothetical protein [Rhodococcus sp. YH1]NCL78729.1 hypothetical protein [Rhodococcus sp. YH1]
MEEASVGPVAGAVSELLAHARGDEAASVLGLVPTIERIRGRPLVVTKNAELGPGVFALWNNHPDRDEILHAPWVAHLDRAIGHEFGHILMGHEGRSAHDTARRTLPPEWHGMARMMLRKYGQGHCPDERERRQEEEAEAFGAELCRRISGAGIARSARIRSLLNEAL